MSNVLVIQFHKDGPKLEIFEDALLTDGKMSAAPLLLPFGFWGHYDWLRDESQTIVGARWYPNNHEFPTNLQEFFAQIGELSYCAWETKGILTVHFFRKSAFLEEYSQDQELDSSSVILLDPNKRIFGLLLNNPPQELVVLKT